MRGGPGAEPALDAAGAETVFFGAQGFGGGFVGAGGFGAGEEFDFDAAYFAVTEFEIADADASVRIGCRPSAELRDDGSGDDAGCALGEDSGLGCADSVDVADCVNAGEFGFERLLIDGDPVVGVGCEAGFDDDLRDAMDGDAEE